MTLRAPHHGYAYQDVITGTAFVDLMLGTAITITVDLKGFAGDRFDDLTINYAAGHRLRLQIKHTTIERELKRATFSSDKRDLRLDLLLRSLLDDFDENSNSTYRVVVRDGKPDSELAQVLLPVGATDDPGDPLPGVTTRRYRFGPEKLRDNKPWVTLLQDFSDDELRAACARLVIDTAAPAASLSFTAPGPAEAALLRRATEELGAGRPPNTNRAAEDVALALAHAATAARAIDGCFSRADLAPRLRLTTDFGAVRDGHPVDTALAVPRTGAAATLHAAIDTTTLAGGQVILTGEPGSGKSWLCEQIADAYRAHDWLVVRHHCWLGETDRDRNERVLAEVVIGSLLSQLEAIVPDAIAELRPRFAATPEALETAIRTCRAKYPDEQLLLIVDGIDHVDRVLGRRVGGRHAADPSRTLVDRLGAISLPDGTCMLISSQPGDHLDNADPASGPPTLMPRMSTDELRSLAQRHGVLDNPMTGAGADPDDKRTIVDLLEARSNGNALYATYLCRHATGTSPLDGTGAAPATLTDIIERLNQVPETATDLDEYYRHLLSTLTPDQELAIGALALCDFALTQDELGQLLPVVAMYLGSALTRLAPVLNSLPGLGGLKVHHESFSRFIRRDKPEAWAQYIRRSAADWLAGRGFFADTRAFRHLPRILADLDAYHELKALIDLEFVTCAVTALQPPEAIKQVLSVVTRQAQACRDWTMLMTCLEARRAVAVYEYESLPDTLVEYADVVVGILGAEVVAERLMYEGRTTFTARWGLSLCEAVDRAGAAPPWEAYIAAHEREAETENTHYGPDSNGHVDLAIQLGHLRLRPTDEGPIDVAILAGHLDGYEGTPPLRDLVEVLVAGLPAEDLVNAARAMTNPGNIATVWITLADLASKGVAGLPHADHLAREAWSRVPGGDIRAYLKYGIDPADIVAGLGSTDLEGDLRAATEFLLDERSVDRSGFVERWLALLTLAHALDRSTPIKLSAALTGEGFFRAWLRFTIATVGLREEVADSVTTPDAASAAVRVALKQLAAEASPFTGIPRAVDLYSIHSHIHDVIERALLVVQPDDLDTVLDHLTAIGEGTTTSLAGMAENGPLATNDLLGIFSRVSDVIGIEPIHKLLPTVRAARDDTHTMYSVTADFEVATARICLDAGARTEADDCWKRAAHLLGAYGGHKDVTITEFVDAVEDLATVDIDAARAALARLQDPAYLVSQHTDGRETHHVPGSWWELSANIDPIAAATNAAALLVSEYGFEDYLAHLAQVELLTTHTAIADPVALAALRLTTGTSWRRPETDVEILTNLQSELSITHQTDIALATFANNVAAGYDNQALMYSRDMPESIATPELVAAVQELGGPFFPAREPRPEKTNNSGYRHHPFRGPGNSKKLLDSTQRLKLPSGPRGAVIAARHYDDKNYGSDPNDLDALVNAIGWRILEATAADGPDAGIRTIDAVARELHYMSNHEIFATLADGIARQCDSTIRNLEQVASYCYTLAYTRIRSGGGWRTFAGRERVDLWTKARALHPDIAERTLAAAIVNNIETGDRGFYGIVQAVIAAFAAQPASGLGGTAVEAWNTAFTSLESRIPGTAARSHPPYVPLSSPDNPSDLNVGLANLAIANIARPKREEIRLALLATAFLIACRPALAQAALIPILQADFDAGRTTWLLETVRDHLPQGELTDGLAARLTDMARSDRLSVRVLAGEILECHRYPVPGPPASQPDAALRLGIANALDELR
ncbi:AAA family ATPase [Nocardia sp. NBC_00403]|uniref:AAA family ATPase n=1 Tax=Nocardia sp. NBC_00403 TaxID=2975990 RepID=UPI002E23D5B1